jgi:type II secretory pathway pseudopilin PulG
MTHPIDPQTSILLESYYTFGLERRLRRYERIRDVMNSWDRDSQFALQILLDEPPERTKDLAIENVSRSMDGPPGFINFPIQHSQRPGRWNKRLLTLLDNGQLYSHKKTDAKLTDKDSQALCMLSDFDLYQITDEDMLRSLRPPKKHSFAIKSQQKSSVFLNTENFVHFFNTDDATLAHDLQHCVHRWRSWYLVNKKVDLGKKEKALHIHGAEADDAKSSDIARIGRHRLKVSVDETPYTIGTFQPLIDMDRFDKPIEEFGKDFLPSTVAPASASAPAIKTDVPLRARGNTVTQTHQSPSTLLASNSIQSPASPTLPAQRIDVFAKEGEFKTTGLLGKTYEGLKQQVESRKSDEQPTDGPFTGGGLLESHKQEVALKQQQHRLEQLQRQQEQVRQLNRSNTTAAKSNSTAMTRSNTTVGKKTNVPLPRSNTVVHSSNSTPVSRTNTPAGAKVIPPIPQSHTTVHETNSTPVSRSNTVATRRAPVVEAEPLPRRTHAVEPEPLPRRTHGVEPEPLPRRTHAVETESSTRRAPAVEPESSARQRSRSRSRTRPSTAVAPGAVRPSTSDGASYGRQRDKPAPLLDMAPAMPEIPTAWRDQVGRGIRAPTGAPLISMATDSRSQHHRLPGMVGSPPISPPGVARRATTKVSNAQRGASAGMPVPVVPAGGFAAPRTGRQRSQSTAATPERRRLASQEARPPMPSIAAAGLGIRHPVSSSSRKRDDDEDVPLINFVDRARGRDLTSRGIEARSRSGPLRHM